MAYTANVTTATITSLAANTTYYIQVLVKDDAGNESVYNRASQLTESFCGGTGTSINPFQICTLGDLNSMRDYLSAFFILNNDIDASPTETWNSGAGWDPVGTSTTYFSGGFDGANKVIHGLTINRPSENEVGLFGQINSNNTFKSLGMIDARVTGGLWRSGIFAAYVGGNATLQYLYSTGFITGYATGYPNGTGGLIGTVDAAGIALSYCFSTARVIHPTGERASGGLIGWSSGNVSFSYATGNVTTNTGWAGGLVGESRGQYHYSYATGDVVNSAWPGTGGLIGNLCCSAAASDFVFATGNVYSQGNGVGGLFGYLSTDLSYGLAEGHVRGTWNTGGLIGAGNNLLSYSLATGKNAAGGDKGALVGDSLTNTQVSDSYAYSRGDGLTCTADSSSAGCKLVTTGSIKPFAFRYAPELEFVQMKFLESPSVPMRKISSHDKDAYTIWGSCTVHGATINISVSDGGSTLVSTATCSGYSWNSIQNFSSLSDGAVTITVNQAGLFAKNLNLTKETSYCDGSPSNGDFASGSGTTGDPYLVCTTAQFDQLRNYLASGTNFNLMNDLDLSSGFSGPIGNDSSGNCTSRFCGVFDGNGFVLRDAYLSLPGTSQVGIFGYVYGATASLKKIGLENIHVIADGDVGTLVGVVEEASVSDSYAQGYVMGVSTTGNSVGGLIGRVNSGLIDRNMAFVHLISRGANSGGLVGTISGLFSTEIRKNRAEGNILSSNQYAGGFAGHTLVSSGMKENISTGHVLGSGNYNSSHVSYGDQSYNSYATGSVLSPGNYNSGFSSDRGVDGNIISKSYAAGHVISPGASKSGLASNMLNDGGSIVDSHFVGHIVSSTGSAGALVGDLGNYPGLRIVSGNYWNHGTQPTTCILNDLNLVDADFCNISTEDYSQFSTFTSPTAIYDNWDFTNVWKWPSASGMPLLKWEFEP